MGGVQSAPEVVAAHAQMKKKVAGARMLEEVAGRQEFEDAEGMVQWTSISQEGMNDLWKELRGEIEEEVIEKYKIEREKKEAYRGRGESLEWRIVKKGKTKQPRKWHEDC